MTTIQDLDHPYSASISLIGSLVDMHKGIEPSVRTESTARPAPVEPPANPAYEADVSAIGADASDSGEYKTACIYDEDCKKGYAVFTDGLGALSYSVFDNNKPASGWSAPKGISLGSRLVSTPRFVHAANDGPVLLACASDFIQLVFLRDGSSLALGNIAYPTGITLPVQGFDATNKNSGGMAQFALIDAKGKLYLNSFTFNPSDGTYAAGKWDDWGSGWAGKPALFFSTSTCWVVAKYIAGRYPYLSYCWANLSNPRNYGSWWNFNYLSSNNFTGSPTFAKNYNAGNPENNYLFSVFSPTSGKTLAYSKENSPNEYPYTSFTEVEMAFNITSEIKFADTFTSNFAPMFFQIEDGKLLMASYVNKESHISRGYRVLSEQVKFFSFVGIPRPDIDRGVVQIFGFLKLASGQDRTVECGEYMYAL